MDERKRSVPEAPELTAAGAAAAARRRDRLAAALRANLRRRKDQSRARSDRAVAAALPGHGTDEGSES